MEDNFGSVKKAWTILRLLFSIKLRFLSFKNVVKGSASKISWIGLGVGIKGACFD